MVEDPPTDSSENGDGGTSRRDILSLVGAGSITTSQLTRIVKADSQNLSSNGVDIIIGYSLADHSSGDIRPVKKTVPEKWYHQLKKARGLKREFEAGRTIAGHSKTDDSVMGAWVSAGKKGEEEPYVELDISDSVPSIQDELEVDGVPTKISPKRKIEIGNSAGATQTDNGKNNSINREAGESIGNGDGSVGTLGAPVSFTNPSPDHFFTCHHIGEGFEVGDNLYTGGSSYAPKIGEIVDVSCSADFAVAKPVNGYGVSTNVHGEPHSIGGMYSKDGLAHLESQGQEVRKSGQTTGVTSGEIEAHDGNVYIPGIECSDRTDQVKWGTNNDGSDGDSGAPVYSPAPDIIKDTYWSVGALHGSIIDYIIDGDYIFGTAGWSICTNYKWTRWICPTPQPESNIGYNNHI